MAVKTAASQHPEPALESQPGSDAFVSITRDAPPVALIVIAVLMVFFTLYFAASLFVPIAAAVLLSMLLATPVQFLERLHVPRTLASAIVVLAAVGFIGAGLAALAGPAQSWIEKAPDSLQKLEHRLFAGGKPFESIKKATDQLQEATGAKARAGPQEVRVMQPALTDFLWSGTLQVAASMFSMTILLIRHDEVSRRHI